MSSLSFLFDRTLPPGLLASLLGVSNSMGHSSSNGAAAAAATGSNHGNGSLQELLSRLSPSELSQFSSAQLSQLIQLVRAEQSQAQVQVQAQAPPPQPQVDAGNLNVVLRAIQQQQQQQQQQQEALRRGQEQRERVVMQAILQALPQIQAQAQPQAPQAQPQPQHQQATVPAGRAAQASASHPSVHSVVSVPTSSSSAQAQAQAPALASSAASETQPSVASQAEASQAQTQALLPRSQTAQAAAFDDNPPKGRRSEFTAKLHMLLTDLQQRGQDHIASFIDTPEGDAFQIHKPEIFQAEILTKYYPRMKSLASFQRQVNLYDFKRLRNHRGSNSAIDAYYHPMFQRAKPDLSSAMKRTKIKGKRKGKKEAEETDAA